MTEGERHATGRARMAIASQKHQTGVYTDAPLRIVAGLQDAQVA
jgi:hypothetical protein